MAMLTGGQDDQGVRLVPWDASGLEVLRRVNTPQMKKHVGGAETDEQVLVRHQRYLDINASGRGRMFVVVLLPEELAVGTVGYHGRVWQGEQVYEMGWNVLPPFQGRGIAVAAATAAVASARAECKQRRVHAFPSVDNPASNAVCRKAGFTLAGACDFEYPPGRPMRSNDWWMDLTETG
ncbi:GNAT family N-acetyltransferase [Kitasatospora mediocidica]|uniref:GNAT family N-acetyltransferase n=1 Tax=Kitasatospora mediocidica TaxID=58352 RepID=UPI001E54404E|nr:GNAT family N-acetyltransferase [Kitasatospora mediocidica]